MRIPSLKPHWVVVDSPFPERIPVSCPEKARSVSKEYKEVYLRIKSHTNKMIKSTDYSHVNLARLFHGLFSLKG